MSVRSSLAWSYGAQALSGVIAFVGGVAAARLLTPYEFGVFALAAAITGMLGVLSAFGVGSYLVREEDPSEATVASAFTVNAILNIVLAAAIGIAALVSRELVDQRGVVQVLALLALLPLLTIFEFLPNAMLTRNMRFGALAVVTVGRALIASGGAVLLAWLGWSYLSFALAGVAGAAFSVVIGNAFERRYLRPRLGLGEWRVITTFGLQMMSIGGVATLAARASEVMLARALGLAALGLYNRASAVSMAVWENAYGGATRVVFSQMAKEKRERGAIRDTFLRATQIITAILWPAAVGIAVLSPPVVHLLYGPEWQGAAAPLSVLMIANFVAFSFAMNWELCVLTGRTAWQARTEVMRAILGLSAFAAGSFFSLAAAAGGRVVEALVGYVVYRPQMPKMAEVPEGELSGVYAESLLLTVVAVAPALGLMIAMRWSPLTPPLAVLGAVLVGVAVWLVTLRMLDHPLMQELAAAAAQVLGRVAPASRR